MTIHPSITVPRNTTMPRDFTAVDNMFSSPFLLTFITKLRDIKANKQISSVH